MRDHLRVFGIAALCCVLPVCFLFVIFTDDELVLKGILAALVVLTFVALFAAAGRWLWESYGPAARRERKGGERMAGPESRERIAFRTESRPDGLGPAFNLAGGQRTRRSR